MTQYRLNLQLMPDHTVLCSVWVKDSFFYEINLVKLLFCLGEICITIVILQSQIGESVKTEHACSLSTYLPHLPLFFFLNSPISCSFLHPTLIVLVEF